MLILADFWGISNDGWVAIGAFAAVGAAVFAWWQGWEARRQANKAEDQANAAKEQVKLMAEQVGLAKQANEIARENLRDQQEARKPQIDIEVVGGDKPVSELYVKITNTCQSPVTIREVRAVCGAEKYKEGLVIGNLEGAGKSNLVTLLPGLLPVGGFIEFHFCRPHRAASHDANKREIEFYGHQYWRDLERIEVLIGAKDPVPAPEGPWLANIRGHTTK